MYVTVCVCEYVSVSVRGGVCEFMSVCECDSL